MTNEDILSIVKQCKLKKGTILISNCAYLFNQKFKVRVDKRFRYEQIEIIVLTKLGKKVGGIYRMGFDDIHCVIMEKYRNQHILSDFFKTGIIKKIWPENTSVKLCNVYTRDEYSKKKYLVELLGMSIKNESEIESFLSYCEEQKAKYSNSNS